MHIRRHTDIRLRTKTKVAIVPKPHTIVDVAILLDNLGLCLENYPAASQHFHNSADEIRKALCSIEITGDLLDTL